eukprot:g31115.t1
MKQEADKKSEIQMFAFWDKVLVLLPAVGDPFKARFSAPYQIEKKLSRAQKEVEAMLQEGITELNQSEWSLPIVLVPKPNGTQRFCVDYWKVNTAEVTFLGHNIGRGRVTRRNITTKVIEEFPRPSSKKEVLPFEVVDLLAEPVCRCFITLL